MELSDLFGTDETSAETRIDMEQAIGSLTFREATVLYLWAVCEYSQSEVGEIVGLSQQRVGQILANISKKA